MMCMDRECKHKSWKLFSHKVFSSCRKSNSNTGQFLSCFSPLVFLQGSHNFFIIILLHCRYTRLYVGFMSQVIRILVLALITSRDEREACCKCWLLTSPVMPTQPATRPTQPPTTPVASRVANAQAIQPSPHYATTRRHSLYGVEDRVIIDPGSRIWKVGFSGEGRPRDVFYAVGPSDTLWNLSKAADPRERAEEDRMLEIRLQKCLRSVFHECVDLEQVSLFLRYGLNDCKARWWQIRKREKSSLLNILCYLYISRSLLQRFCSTTM